MTDDPKPMPAFSPVDEREDKPLDPRETQREAEIAEADRITKKRREQFERDGLNIR